MRHHSKLAPPIAAALILSGLGSLGGCGGRSNPVQNTDPARGAAERKQVIALQQVPSPARSAIESTVGNGKIEVIEFNADDRVYDVEFVREGRRWETEVAAAGEVQTIERELRLEEAPEPVRATIMAESKGGSVEEIVEVKLVKENRTRYEAEIARGQQLVTVEIGPRGRVLNRSSEPRSSEKPKSPSIDPAKRY